MLRQAVFYEKGKPTSPAFEIINADIQSLERYFKNLEVMVEKQIEQINEKVIKLTGNQQEYQEKVQFVTDVIAN